MIFKAAPVLAFTTLLVGSCFCCGQELTGVDSTSQPLPPAPPPQEQQQFLMHAPTCPMVWEKPGPAGYSGELPEVGEVPFDWTDHPDAASYNVKVTDPNGAVIDYESDSSKKSLFMENYKDAGIYYVEVSALDKNGLILCNIDLTFTKDQVINVDQPDNPQANPTIVAPPEEDNPPQFHIPILIIVPTDPPLDVPK